MRLLYVCIMCAFLPLMAQDLRAPLPPDRMVVQTYYPNDKALQKLLSQRAPWELNRRAGFLILDLSEEEMEALAMEGFQFQVDWHMTDQLQQPLAPLVGQQSGIPGFPCYATVAETFAQAEAWETEHPDLVQWVDIGDSWEKTQNPDEGHDIRVLLLSNQNIMGPKPSIFIMSSVHAREYSPAGVNFMLARTLIENYGVDPTVTWLLDHHQFHLLLQANPDGRVHAETGLFWRKNTNDNFCSGTSTRGIDLNRNFDFQWGCCNGSSGNACSEVFRGPFAASEPEIQAIQDYVREIFPDQRDGDPSSPAPSDATGIFVDVHSAGGLVLWPYGFSAQSVPNPEHRPLGRKLAFFNDYDPLPISQFTIADGSTVDYTYGELGVASLAYELGSNFFQSCSSFEATVGPDNRDSLLYLARHARTPYLSASGPDPVNIQTDVNTTPGSLIITATVDDTRYSNNNGTEPTHNIIAANVYIDIPPWETGAEAIPLWPTDGLFNSPIEEVQATIDMTGLAAGRHIVYVTATDGSGATGAPDAGFFETSFSYETLLSMWPTADIRSLIQALPPQPQ